jgi:hypothetical protein
MNDDARNHEREYFTHFALIIIILLLLLLHLLLLLLLLLLLVQSFGLFNDLFPFPPILDAGYPVSDRFNIPGTNT